MPCRVIGLKVKNAGPVEHSVIGERLPDRVPTPPGSDQLGPGMVNANPVNRSNAPEFGVDAVEVFKQ